MNDLGRLAKRKVFTGKVGSDDLTNIFDMTRSIELGKKKNLFDY